MYYSDPTSTLFSFPGITANDTILELLKLMAQRDPNLDIESSIATSSIFDPCKYDLLRKNEIFTGCENGSIPDLEEKYCYKVLPKTNNFEDGQFDCEDIYDSNLIQFDNNEAVLGFLAILDKGDKNTS